MRAIATLLRKHRPAGRLALAPLNSVSLRDQAYTLLKDAIASTDIYSEREPLRLDERELMQALGVSRTPVREALSILEQEGFVRTVPRRGIFIVRKSKREIIEMIQMWAALESMSARLATLHAPDTEISKLRHLFDEFQSSPPTEHLDEYSDANIAFHQMIIRLGGSRLIAEATKNLFLHVRAIRRATISQNGRAARSIIDHLKIIEAGDHRLLDGLGAVDLHGDVEAGELPTEHLAHRIPGVGSRFALHEALAVQSRARYLPHPGERVAWGRHDVIRVRRERQRDDVHIARRSDHYGEVSEIVGELAQQALPIVHREIECDARMLGAEGRQHPRKEVVPGADDRDVEAPAGHPLELRQRLFGLLEALGDGPGTLQHLLAGGGEEALATDALEQRQADVGRELLDLRRHRRLRQVQLFGGTREGHVPGRRREHPQLPQRQVLHSPPAYPHSGILKSLWSR